LGEQEVAHGAADEVQTVTGLPESLGERPQFVEDRCEALRDHVRAG
jgi:hypothetical protein